MNISPEKPVAGRNVKLPLASHEMTEPLPDVSPPTDTTDSWGSELGLRGGRAVWPLSRET
jgi:hypothetical protein